MRIIYYWEDTSWVEEKDLHKVSHRLKDSHSILEAPDYFTDKDISNHILTILYRYCPNYD
jgi:hypothetical protein